MLLADITGSLWCSLSEDLRDLVHTVSLADITGSLWCSLSEDLRDLVSSSDSFRRLLKTRLFSEY